MKIVQLSYSLSSGGAERFVVDLSNHLSMIKDNEVILLTTDDDKITKNIHYLDELSSNVKYINLHCKGGLHPKSFFRVYKALKDIKPDIVHAHCNLLLIYMPAFFLKRIKFVHTLHNMAEICLKYKWCKFINKWLYKKRIQPITISRKCQESFIKLYNIKKVTCITNGSRKLTPTGHMPTDISFVDRNIPIFIHVARCATQKNHNRLFNAFDKLFSDGIKFHLIVLGSGYEAIWMQKYRNNKQIHILGERKNVADYMAVADFFVLSSDYEGLPLTLLEAMSLGVIPISTPAGGVIDVIRDGENGYLTSNFDDNELYKKIKQALNERGKIKKELVIKEYEDSFSMDICANKYYKEYKKIFST